MASLGKGLTTIAKESRFIAPTKGREYPSEKYFLAGLCNE
jgi:hypothetical protein